MSQSALNTRGAGEPAERFVQLFTANEREIRSYLFHLLPARDDVDEVMQQVSLVLWKKFDDLEEESGFVRWACVVARYEVLAYRRRKARDRLVFSEALLVKLSEDYVDDLDEVSNWKKSFGRCFEKLSEQSRLLMLRAYGGGLEIQELAVQLGRTANSVYKELGRLRRALVKCVELRRKSLEAP